MYWQKVGEDDYVCIYTPGSGDPVRGPDYIDNIEFIVVGMIFFCQKWLKGSNLENATNTSDLKDLIISCTVLGDNYLSMRFNVTTEDAGEYVCHVQGDPSGDEWEDRSVMNVIDGEY